MKIRYFLLLLIIGCLFLIFIQLKRESKSETTPPPQATDLSTPSPTSTSTEKPTPSPTVQKLSKKLYKVAAIGDSMIETIGGNLDYLYKELKKKYPDTDFYMYNFGISSENVIEGLARFDKPFAHSDRSYPSISEVKPDVIIVGSYAYNPPQGDTKTLHFNALSEMIKKARSITGNTYVLAEIAPLKENFGNGPGGINWPPELVATHVAKIVDLMQNARSLPGALNVRLIDVYSKTTSENSPYGQAKFVDSYDNIHPSIYGHTFMAQVMVEVIKFP